MSIITKPVVAFGHSTTFHTKPSHRSFAIIKHKNPCLGKRSLKFLDNVWRVQNNDKRKRSFVVYNVVQPEVPPPSGPPFNVLNWIVGVVLSIVLPFFSLKWGQNSILKVKNKVETAVNSAEVIVHVVEKVAEDVEKAAEHIAADLPKAGKLRQAIDFVENVAEITARDAHLVGDFIDKVQEAEEKVQACIESLAQEVEVQEQAKEEDTALEQPKETSNEEIKHY